jgi:hypothetical protein
MSPTGIDTQLAEDVLALLYQGSPGLIELRSITSSGATPRCFAPLGATALREFLVQHATENLYLGVATRRDATSGALTNCAHLPALFVDVDYKTQAEPEARARLARCPLTPSLIVSSGGGLDVYWASHSRFDRHWCFPNGLRSPLASNKVAEASRSSTGGPAYSAVQFVWLRRPATTCRRTGPSSSALK